MKKKDQKYNFFPKEYFYRDNEMQRTDLDSEFSEEIDIYDYDKNNGSKCDYSNSNDN